MKDVFFKGWFILFLGIQMLFFHVFKGKGSYENNDNSINPGFPSY